jgi:hypothetical protein
LAKKKGLVSIVSELETRICESYERLHVGKAVYLLKDEWSDYGELPDPNRVTEVYKANVFQIDRAYRDGISLVTWSAIDIKPEKDETETMHGVSPREVFKLNEINTIINDSTSIHRPKQSKLDRYIDSKSGIFATMLAAEMARVIIERFIEDPRDDSGHLIKR